MREGGEPHLALPTLHRHAGRHPVMHTGNVGAPRHAGAGYDLHVDRAELRKFIAAAMAPPP